VHEMHGLSCNDGCEVFKSMHTRCMSRDEVEPKSRALTGSARPVGFKDRPMVEDIRSIDAVVSTF
jgi:hypothetical protein